MIKEIHIFKAGTQTSAQGVTREFTKDDLKQIADSYKPDVHEAPIRIGHEDNDKVPAWGWVKDVTVKGDELYAEVEFSPLASDYVKNNLYKKVSASFYSPESKINPEPGKWSLRHVALLGAQPPAVKGLKGFAYEETAEGVLDFAATLTPDQVFDKELGPTLKRDLGPLELLKEKLDEARSQMTEEEKSKEQELQASPAEEAAPADDSGEFAERMTGMRPKKGKSTQGGKEGTEGADEETEEGSVDMSSCESKKKKKGDEMGYEEDDEQHGESTALRDGKPGSLKQPSTSLQGSEVETADGEGPEASKVKKNSKSGACDSECEDDKKYEEPTMEASKKKRGTDHLNSTDSGAKETQGGPGGLVRTKSSSKGVDLGDALSHEELEDDELKDDDEQHVETDNHKYVDRAKLYKIKKGEDGMVGHKAQDPYDDQSGRGLTGKAGDSGVTKRGSKGTSGSTGDTGRDKKGTDGGELDKNYKDAYTGKSSQQDDERGMTGKHDEIKGYPAKHMSTGGPRGGGKQVKDSRVRVMELNHSEGNDRLAEMLARLEALEAENSRLKSAVEFSERQLRRTELEAFVDGLYESGQLTDAIVDQHSLVEYMEGLELGTLEFAEGETAATPLMRILESLPSQVCFTEIAGGEVPTRDEDLDPHERAVKLAKEENIEYAEALKAVLYSDVMS